MNIETAVEWVIENRDRLQLGAELGIDGCAEILHWFRQRTLEPLEQNNDTQIVRAIHTLTDQLGRATR
jgi:hypothetical protein